jgi:hypothetical protein
MQIAIFANPHRGLGVRLARKDNIRQCEHAT